MRWLLTTKTETSEADLESKLTALGAHIEKDEPPVPLGEDEKAILVTGPRDLREKMLGDEKVLDVSEVSEMSYFVG